MMLLNPYRFAAAPSPPGGDFLWNPADKDAAVTLSAGNATATITPTTASVRGDVGKSSGRWFYELTVSGGTFCLIGVGNSTAALNSYPGADGNSIGYFGVNGGKLGGSSGGGSGASYGPGDVITVDFNASTGDINFYKNGVVQGGTGTIATGFTYFPMFGCGGAGANCVATINDTPLYPVAGASQWG